MIPTGTSACTRRCEHEKVAHMRIFIVWINICYATISNGALAVTADSVPFEREYMRLQKHRWELPSLAAVSPPWDAYGFRRYR